MKLSVFILAAGLGERLQPITDHIPKPLLPILGKPVLQYILEKISILPINKIGINLHHKKEVIENWVRKSPFHDKIKFFFEDSILGTGGAFKNAEAFLNSGPFLVHNSDILSDIDLEKLIAFHLSSKNLATLAVHNHPEFNKLAIDGKGFLREVFKHPRPNPSFSIGMGSNSPHSPIGGMLGGVGKILTFTGIAVYQPEFLKFLPAGISNVVNAWLNAIEAGYQIGTFDVSGCYWRDIGTPTAYAKTVIDELKKNGETVYINSSVNSCKHAEMDGYVVLENGSTLVKGISLRNCILLPGSNPAIPPLEKGNEGGFLFENCIVGPGFKIDLHELEITETSHELNAILIGVGGSDRKYYRVKRNETSVVIMQCLDNDPDFQRHIEYTSFFLRHSVPVPELITKESEKMCAIFEDLGDLSLYSWLKCPHDQDQIEKIFKRVIDVLVLIHIEATEHVFQCPLLQNRIFDYEHLRWETSYFIERFAKGIKNIRIEDLSALNDEFHRLAIKVDSFHKTVIHRDFQSQNIMLTKRGIPRLLDYQGARIGPPAYDVVSILWDPYYRLQDNMRERLLNYYIKHMTKPPQYPFSKWVLGWFTENDFRETLLPCRLQRHMQALGAYGFLSTVKGKKYFLKYLPGGLRLLKEDVSLSKDEYPRLYKLVMDL
jgi:NDP-sugar pyrophosphorylase family protein/aminoglycoside/choline kinase family phosphotransferase